MELTDEQIEVIREASREIDFGRITVSFTGNPSYVVDIVAEKHVRFSHRRDSEHNNGGAGGTAAQTRAGRYKHRDGSPSDSPDLPEIRLPDNLSFLYQNQYINSAR